MTKFHYLSEHAFRRAVLESWEEWATLLNKKESTTFCCRRRRRRQPRGQPQPQQSQPFINDQLKIKYYSKWNGLEAYSARALYLQHCYNQGNYKEYSYHFPYLYFRQVKQFFLFSRFFFDNFRFKPSQIIQYQLSNNYIQDIEFYRPTIYARIKMHLFFFCATAGIQSYIVMKMNK